MLLASLALAALAGVVAVLLPQDDIVIRVMQTGFATAFAAALALPVSMLLDRAWTRPAGLYGLGGIVVEFILALVIVWGEPWLPRGRLEDLGLTMLFAAIVGVPVMACIVLTCLEPARIAGYTGIAAGALCFASIMIALWPPTGGWRLADDWAETGGAFGGIGTLLILGLLGLGAEGARKLATAVRVAAATAGLVSLALILLAVWNVWDGGEIIVLVVSATVIAAYTNVIGAARLRAGQRWVRGTGLVAAVLTAIFLNVLVFSDGGIARGLFERLTAAAGIVTACATMAVLVLLAWNRRTRVEWTTTAITSMTIVCPRCQRRQDVAVGNCACDRCGLRMQIRVEDPHCAKCGYRLYNIESEQCPECGTPVGSAG